MLASAAPNLPRGVIQIALVEDDPYFRIYLESILAASPRHHLQMVAGSAAEADAWPPAARVHVVLVDVGLPDRPGPEVVRMLTGRYPGILCIMLSAESGEAQVLDAIRAGAVGYLQKGATTEMILEAVDDALAGGAPMSPNIARKVLGLMRQAPAPAPAAGAGAASAGRPSMELAILTERELGVLELVADGAADKEVADKLGIARSTVKNTLLAIYAKWRVRSRTEAAVKFVRARPGGGA